MRLGKVCLGGDSKAAAAKKARKKSRFLKARGGKKKKTGSLISWKENEFIQVDRHRASRVIEGKRRNVYKATRHLEC